MRKLKTTMNIPGLPDNLKFQYCYADKQLDLSNWTAMTHSPLGDAIKTTTKDGESSTNSPRTLFDKLSQYSCIFTYNPPNQDDLLLSLLTEEELRCLNLLGIVETNGHEIKKLRSFLRIDKTPIISLFPMTKKDLGETFESVDLVARQVIASREFGMFNMSTRASEARALITQVEPFVEETRCTKRLGFEVMDKAVKACHGGRMESSGIGSSYQVHYDMIKAHLGILESYPGLYGLTKSTSNTGFDRALPISIYLIKADIPQGLKYNPLPVNADNQSGISYPNKEVKGWYFKRYLELLQKLKIPFRTLDSIQFFGKPTYPLKEWAGFIRGYSKFMEEVFPNLEYKHLYSTIAGSCKSVYMALGKDHEVVNRASRIIDPWIYGYVLSEQNCLVYEEALEEDADAIKIDSVALRRRANLGPRFRIKGEGMSTYLTPSLKTIPGGNSLYRDEINNQRSKESLVIRIKTWTGLSSLFEEPNSGEFSDNQRLGKVKKRFITIKPHFGGNRTGKKPDRVGDLLHRWIESVSRNSTDAGTDLSLQKLETYVTRTNRR